MSPHLRKQVQWRVPAAVANAASGLPPCTRDTAPTTACDCGGSGTGGPAVGAASAVVCGEVGRKAWDGLKGGAKRLFSWVEGWQLGAGATLSTTVDRELMLSGSVKLAQGLPAITIPPVRVWWIRPEGSSTGGVHKIVESTRAPSGPGAPQGQCLRCRKHTVVGMGRAPELVIFRTRTLRVGRRRARGEANDIGVTAPCLLL